MNRPRWGLRPTAILLGVAVDIGGTFLAAFVVMVVAVVWQAARGQDADPTSLMQRPPLRLVFLTTGLLLTGIGGYVAARLAPGGEYRNALAMAILSLALGALMTVVWPNDQPDPLWYTLASWGGMVPMALFGAYVHLETRTRVRPGS